MCAQVEKAAKLFKQAGCVQSDIKAALTSHIKHDEIDIPQDEPEEAKKVSSCCPLPPPHACYSTAAQGQILELSSCLTLQIGGPDMHAIACFLWYMLAVMLLKSCPAHIQL